MNNFLSQFQPYNSCVPPGVRLPQITIDQSHYDKLDLPNTTSNFDFLRSLCLKGVEEKGITSLTNKDEYYSRTKKELRILRDSFLVRE